MEKDDLKKLGVVLKRALYFITCSGKMMYNTKLELFPSNIVAGMFNFKARELFATESDEARKNVKVDFNK